MPKRSLGTAEPASADRMIEPLEPVIFLMLFRPYARFGCGTFSITTDTHNLSEHLTKL